MREEALSSWRFAVAVCCERANLWRTICIALVVGTILTLINQLDVMLRGDATSITFVKTGLNYVVPFVVSNLGVVAGARNRR